jgi:hypothetical protein
MEIGWGSYETASVEWLGGKPDKNAHKAGWEEGSWRHYG